MLSRTIGVRSYRSSPTAIDATCLGSSQAGSADRRIFRGFVREVWSHVPPVRSMVRVLTRSSSRT